MTAKLQPTKEMTIDGTKYIVQFYAPTEGYRLYAKLIRILGEPLIKLFGVFKGKSFKIDQLMSGDLEDLNIDAVGEALSKLFSQLSDDDVVPLMKEILSSTFTANGVSVVDQFETLFMGRYSHGFKVVAKTLGAQYPDFLSGIVKRANAVKSVSASNLAKEATG